jgi:riboflavin kinase/FMN adenylyltransferase
VVGDNFFFGKDRRGNPQFLQDYCKANNKTCIVVPAFYWQKEKVSSSLIRTALKDGDADKAKNLLGRPFRYSGVVIHGHHRGRSIGVPTANLQTAVQFSPRLGVYCSKLLWQGQSYPSITNVGINPTVTSSSNLKIETHVLQKDINLYDQSVAVDLLHFLRDEKNLPVSKN